MDIKRILRQEVERGSIAGKAIRKSTAVFFNSSRFIKKQFGKTDFSYEKIWQEEFLKGGAVRPDHLRLRDDLLDKDRRKNQFSSELLKQITMLSVDGKRLKVIDLGSGPLSDLAYGVDKGLIEVVAVDPLADFYNKKMEKHRIVFPIQPIYAGTGEKLAKQFEKHSFDISYSSNAIDHAVSPKQCLENLCYVVREKGLIFIRGWVNEGTHTGWIGLHQHDLVPEGGNLIHYSRKGERTNLTDGLPLKHISSNIIIKSESQGRQFYEIVFERI